MLQRANPAAMPPMPALDAPPWAWSFAALAVALVAQATVLAPLRFHGGGVGFVTLLALWFTARAGIARGAFFALIAGACEDAVAGNTGAAWTIATPLAAALGGAVLRGIGSDNPLVFAALAAVTVVVRLVAFRLVLQVQDMPAGFDAASLHATLWSSAFSAIVAAIVLLALPRLRPLRVDHR